MRNDRAAISRRNLLCSGVAAAAGGLGYATAGSAPHRPGTLVKISPVPGRSYPQRFLQFAERARFRSPQCAVRAVKNQEIEYELELVTT